jgi:hypothetical protein
MKSVVNDFYLLKSSKDLVFVHSVDIEKSEVEAVIYMGGTGLTSFDIALLDLEEEKTVKDFLDFYKEKLILNGDDAITFFSEVIQYLKLKA